MLKSEEIGKALIDNVMSNCCIHGIQSLPTILTKHLTG